VSTIRQITLSERQSFLKQLLALYPQNATLRLRDDYGAYQEIIELWYRELQAIGKVTQYCLGLSFTQASATLERSSLERCAALFLVSGSPCTAMVDLLLAGITSLDKDAKDLAEHEEFTEYLDETRRDLNRQLGQARWSGEFDEPTETHFGKPMTLVTALKDHPELQGEPWGTDEVRRGMVRFIYSLASKQAHPSIVVMQPDELPLLTSLLPFAMASSTVSAMQVGDPWKDSLRKINKRMAKAAGLEDA